MQSSDYLVWIDLEMTGLKPDTDVIIEMATIVTDLDLNIVAEGPVIAIHQPPEVLDAMDEWNKRTHGASGLIDRVRSSSYTMASAEKRTLESLTLAGRAGLLAHVRQQHLPGPALPRAAHAHAREIFPLPQPGREHAQGTGAPLGAFDHPRILQAGRTHQALADIQESIRELAYYRENFLAPEYQKL